MKDMNARDFGWKFNGEFSVRLFHTLVQRPISEFSLKEIQQKDFLDKPNIGIKTWNEFVEIRNLYFNNWKKKKTNTKKTAMQEAIDKVSFVRNMCNDENNEMDLVHTLETLKKDFIELLEKEKEQIIEAGNACSIKTIVHREKLDEMSEDELRDSLVEDTISHGEEYYNQTYNQNELPKTYINGVEVDSDNSSVTTTGVWTPKTN
jgi:hypothetical protein